MSIYGVRSPYSAFSASHALTAVGEEVRSAVKTALLTLAFTRLNPHAYLDATLLLNLVSTKFSKRAGLFGAGAMCASFAFFALIRSSIFSSAISKAGRMENFGVFRRRVRAFKLNDQIYVVLVRCFYAPLAKLC